MKAWVLHGIDDIRFEEAAKPETADSEVLVAVQAAGICGSDIPRIYKTDAHTHPLIPSHEFSGVVERAGALADKKWEGKRVGVFPLIPCRECVACRKRQYELCRNYSYLGSRRNGGFAEYVSVPEWNLIELPVEVSFVEAAMLEPMAVAVHAMRREQLCQGDTVVVYGLGTIGMFLVMFLMQTLIDFEYAKALNSQNIDIKVHIKIDTGMHRLGISSGEFSSIKKAFFMHNLNVCGIFTHLSCADSRLPEDVTFTREQIGSFYRLIDALRDNGINIPKQHIQSSYGLLNYPELVCDYIRVGIALYGVFSSPNNDTVLKLDLHPVLSLKSRVVLIRSVNKGDSIGYGRSYTTERDSRIAIIPIGYGDGLPRNLSGRNHSVMINKQIVPIIGRICMDQIAVDITDATDVMVGDIVTLIGAEGYDELSAPVIANNAGSISNELLCGMGVRLPVMITCSG